MTELDPSYTENGCTTAQADRQLISSLVCGEGVAFGNGGDLEVTQRGAGANMSVDVADGNGFAAGTESAWQGMYHGSNDATKNITIAAADPTDPRIDLIVMTFRDSLYSGTDDDWILQRVAGTPSPAPSPPALPDNSLLLASVAVAAGATSITDANITDERVPYTPCGGGGSLLDTLVFTASDTFVKADYAAMTYVDVEVQASGGGGGGAGSGHPKCGAGGGSGGYARAVIPVGSLASSETITIGAGGPGGVAGATGTNGATSSFGTHVSCAGGQGGESGGTGTFPSGGDSGNVPTAPAGAIEIEGQDGAYGWGIDQGGGDYTITAGDGADSPLGLGGRGYTRPDNPVGASTAGRDGTGYGSGGGGAINTLAAGGGAANGGAGADGVIIVRVYG